ncbi:MAG TPA: UDP-N-acetylmuramate dehydrogenase [Bacteroidales bacterium]|nr:UDP-N-acetylmuramate dehydrogenase [Bacteroidales bacterium]
MKDQIKTASNKSLKQYNTFNLDAKARHFVAIEDAGQAMLLVNKILPNHERFMILGGGSNTLFVNDFNGLIIHVAMKGIEVLEETDTTCTVKVAAGEDWPEFVDFCVERDWGGVENLALIPGQVGASPVQNIGAYGREVKDVIEEVHAIDLQTGEEVSFNNDECHFAYRDSLFKSEKKDRYLITFVDFKLHKEDEFYLDYGSIRDEIRKSKENVSFKSIANAVKRIRRSKLPDVEELGSAGSFFKNPVINADDFEQLREQHPDMPFFKVLDGFKIPAGWLIDQCGWKGFREKDYGVYPHQALVLVNYGKASGKEIHALSEKIRDDVVKKFGIALHREVTIVE